LRSTGSQSLFQHPDVRFVGLNVDATDAHKLSAIPLVCDARRGLAALADELPPVDASYREDIASERSRWSAALSADLAAPSEDRLTQGQVYATVNATARPGDWVVAAAGWAPGDVLKAWRVPVGGRAHIEFGFSCMGHEIPAALGIRMHGAEGEIVVLIGDGTYLMGASELVTAVQEGWRLTVVVLENGGFGSIDALARDKAGVSVGNTFVLRDGGGPLGVDYAANARSFGCNGVLAADADALRRALLEARQAERATVIVCPTASGRPLLGSGAFWDLGVAETGCEPAVAHEAERARRQRTF
jgi:3D-(3,5/4)-trihydroxycyclohexane-1,2-dione acylhydrolase (decyclizing)